MPNVNPSPADIRQAFLDYDVDVKFYKGWDKVGRPWKGPDGSPGLTGGVIHHTATKSAVGPSGAPSLYWCTTAYSLPVCNFLQGRGPGDSYLLAAGSVYHCGDGGPVPDLGVPKRGFGGQYRFFGIEIDDAGLRTNSITDFQIQNTSKIMAALADLCGWDIDIAIGTHKCYTDGCHGWNPKGPSATVGRKNDTIDGPWKSWPGSDKPEPYNAPWWRQNVAKYSKANQPTKPLWDNTIPMRSAAEAAFNNTNVRNKAAYRLAARLYDLGYMKTKPAVVGRQKYPADAVKAARVAWGWKEGNGKPTANLWKKLFGVDKPQSQTAVVF